jgi:PEP-CTERM motif
MKATKYALGAALGLFLIGGATNARADGTTTQNLEFFNVSFVGAGGIADVPAQDFINIFDLKVFMGPLSSPTFVPGTYLFSDPANSWALSSATDLTLIITSTNDIDNFSLFDDNGNKMTWSLPSSPTGVTVDPVMDGFVIDGVTISEISASSVPEPSTLLLLGIGLAGLASARRKIWRRLS